MASRGSDPICRVLLDRRFFVEIGYRADGASTAGGLDVRIALVGVGSLGTIAGGLLSKVGLDIVLIDANEEHGN